MIRFSGHALTNNAADAKTLTLALVPNWKDLGQIITVSDKSGKTLVLWNSDKHPDADSFLAQFSDKKHRKFPPDNETHLFEDVVDNILTICNGLGIKYPL